MQTRVLGGTHMKLSVIGLGTWAIGGPWKMGWGSQDDRDSISAIHAALASGVNWIDTAPAYGFGHSEEIVGRAIKGRQRDKVIIATKCGLVKDGSGGIGNNLSADSVADEIDASLARLGVDYIDLYQIHWPNPENQIEEAWKEIHAAIAAGKIRHAGVSNFSVEQMKQLQRFAPIASLQPPYSMLRRAIEKNQMPFCRDNDIGILAYSPMLSGMLTGKVTKERVSGMGDNDWRSKSKEWQEPNLSVNIDFVETVLRPIADAHDCEPAQIAIAWALRGDLITAAIVGARDEQQAAENAKAAEIDLTTEEIDAIQKGLDARAAKLEV